MSIPKTIIILLAHFISLRSFSQGHIEHIKNQKYLELKAKVNCETPDGDNLTERICANLAYQKSDSLLAIIYDSLLIVARNIGGDSTKHKIIILQKTWRTFRDKHYEIIDETYEDCGGCHQRAIDYLNCLRELTDHRILELKKLKKLFDGG